MKRNLILLATLSICYSFLSAQDLNMNDFISEKKEKVPLSELRKNQKGHQLSFLYSNTPTSFEIRWNNLTESTIPIGYYLGIGFTQSFIFTIPSHPLFELLTVASHTDSCNIPYISRSGDYEYNKSRPYLSLGVSKNLSNKHTIYTGIAFIASPKRSDDRCETFFEEGKCYDIGYLYRTRKISISLGWMFHLPYYEMKETYGFEYRTRARTQLGLGYNF